MLIRGNSYMDYNALDIQLNPCLPNITAKTCLDSTLEKIKEYLGFPEIITLTNKQRVNTTELNERVVVKESRVWNSHIDLSQPTYIQNFVKLG
jgi:hypothetical protein